MTHKVTKVFLIIYGSVDIVAWIFLMLGPEESDIILVSFVSYRVTMSAILYYFLENRVGQEHAIFVGISAATLFFLFSIAGLIGVYLLINRNSKTPLRKAKLYHIDKEEGEEKPDSILLEKPILIDFNELREVAPLADGMTDDDTIMRIAAISAIEETESTNLFNILIESKKDADKEVQYYAHEALKKIGDRYMKKINDLLDAINNSGPDYKTYKELADLYAVLAHKNIEHPILVRFYRQEAIKYYSYLLDNYQDHRKDILKSLIPVLYENGDYRLCISNCKKLLNEYETSYEGIEYMSRSLFRLRDIDTLNKLAYEHRNTYPGLMDEYTKLTKDS